MDQRRFDDLARLLGASGTRRTGLRAALGGVLGLGVGSATLDADAKRRRDKGADAAAGNKRRRKRCKPACTDGFECVKVGRKRECQCPTGVTCGAACCRIGQVCDNETCVPEPEPVACIAAGEPCKSVGLPCCDGRTCASGQGGEADIACYVPKTGACTATADCVYGMLCQSGRCAPPAPVEGLGVACDAAAQQLCTTPGATCTAYTGSGAPGGTHCTLPLQKTCTGDPQCTCYKCWYTASSIQGNARARASSNTLACCHMAGLACSVDQDCCLGLSCVNGTCGGSMCVPDNAAGCDGSTPCCTASAGTACIAGTCTPAPELGEACTVGGAVCITQASTCSAGNDASTTPVKLAATTICCRASGLDCGSDVDCCFGTTCSSGSCAPCTVAAGHLTPNLVRTGSFETAPRDVAFLSDGRMVVTNKQGGSGFAGATVLSKQNGAWVKTATMSVPETTQPYQDQQPLGLAVDANDKVYIAYGNNTTSPTGSKVFIFQESGGTWSPVGNFGRAGTVEDEKLVLPRFLAFGLDGRLYVTEAAGGPFPARDRVSIWRNDGGTWVFDEAFGTSTTLNDPSGVTVAGSGEVIVASEGGGDSNVKPVSIWRKVSGTWTRIETIGTYGTGTPAPGNQFEQPKGVSLVRETLFVADSDQHRVSVWQLVGSTWTFQSTFGVAGAVFDSTTSDALQTPEGLNLGPDGLMYVATYYNGVVSPWGPTCGNG